MQFRAFSQGLSADLGGGGFFLHAVKRSMGFAVRLSRADFSSLSEKRAIETGHAHRERLPRKPAAGPQVSSHDQVPLR